jgi:hypothetical protein
VRDGSQRLADRQALHLLALPRTGQQDLRRQGTIFAYTKIIQSGGGVAASRGHHVGRAFYRRLALRAGKPKAVTATARKIAVVFYKTLRHGLTYRDPGADPYEQQYRSRVVAQSETTRQLAGAKTKKADSGPSMRLKKR